MATDREVIDRFIANRDFGAFVCGLIWLASVLAGSAFVWFSYKLGDAHIPDRGFDEAGMARFVRLAEVTAEFIRGVGIAALLLALAMTFVLWERSRLRRALRSTAP